MVNAVQKFNQFQLSIIRQDEEDWLTAEDIGKALGLAEPRKSVINIFNRNRDEFEGLYRVTSSMTWLKSGRKIPHRYTMFNLQGAYLLAILARTPKSKALRRWLSKFMAQDLNRLRDNILNMSAEHYTIHEKDQKQIAELEGRVRGLIQQAKPLPPLPAVTQAVQVDFTELQQLFLFSKAHGCTSFPDNYLHQVIERDEKTPRFKLEVTMPGGGTMTGMAVMTLMGTVAANLF